MIIWEEYRLHAIVFSLRCLSVFLYGYFLPPTGSIYSYFFLPIMVLSHHLVVDEITRRYGSDGSTTVRVDNSSTPFSRFVLRFYSFYQFVALAAMLVPFPGMNLMACGYNALVAIQSSAFLMTLYRKGLIAYYTHAFWYSICLIFSASNYLLLVPSASFFLFAVFCAYILRVVFRLNKYFIWTLFSICCNPLFLRAVAEATPLGDHLGLAHSLPLF